MKTLLLTLATIVVYQASGQQLTSNVPNANADNSNILLANPNAMNITNDKRATIWLDNDGKLKFRAVTGNGFAFRNYANTDDQVVIDASGNLGIGLGIVSPIGKLHINAPLDGSISAITIGDANSGNIAVPGQAAVGGYNIDFRTWRDIVPNQTGARIRAERINNFSPNSALIQSMDLVFYTSGGYDQDGLTEKLRINAAGNVGIGTADAKGYKLAVAGNAIAESVTVKMQSTWPDYVFRPDFKLLPLTEVKTYIDKNYHLPGIPSAEQIAKQGLNLGEMNKLLIKKVEELTLYLIEKDKKEKDQERQTNILKEQVNLLKEQMNKIISSLNK